MSKSARTRTPRRTFKERVLSGSVNNLAFFNILGPLLVNLLNFLTLPIITRALGPSHYGLASLYLSWCQLFASFIGLQVSGTIATSMVHYSREEEKKYLSSIIGLSLLSFVATTVTICVGMRWFVQWIGFSPLLLLFLMTYAYGTFALLFANIYFTYQKKAYINFLINLGLAVSQVGLAFIFIYLVFPANRGDLALIYSYVIPYSILGVGVVIYFVRQGKILYHKAYWLFCLPLCIPLIFHGLSQIVLAHSSKYILQQMRSNTDVGIYALAVALITVLNALYNALNNTWVPFYYDDLKDHNDASIRERGRSYMLVFAVLCAGFVLVSPEVIRFLANAQFASAQTLMPLLMPGQFFIFLYSFSVNFQFFHRKTVNIAVGTALAALVNIGLNIALIPVMGTHGAALATTLAYCGLWIFHEVIARHRIKAHYPFLLRDYMPSLAMVCAVSVAAWALMTFWIARWAIAAGFGLWLIARVRKQRTLF